MYLTAPFTYYNLMASSNQKEIKNYFFKLNNSPLKKCLFPPMTCKETAIKAHTVQNSKMLAKIVHDGHVIMIGRRVDKEIGLVCHYKKVGRKEATTFTGLCSYHDQHLFRPIETQSINISNLEQLFLLSYRAVLRELHATMDGAIKLQSMYHKKVSLGILNSSQPSAEGVNATKRLMVSYETYLYKTKFDRVLLTKAYNDIIHVSIELSEQPPTIAASALFTLDKLNKNKGVIRVSLNILPTDRKKTLVLFSFHKDDKSEVMSVLDYIFKANGQYQKYEISKLLLNHCENFVISPTYFRKWSKRKRNSIKEFYETTILESKMNFQDKDLYLF